MNPPLGQLVQSFFNDYLPVQKGLRLGSIRSYRDTVSLLLRFLAKHNRRPVAKLALGDLTLDSVLGFLAHLEHERGNSPRTRNQRRAALSTLFSYLAVRVPDMLAACQQIACIPVKRTPLPDTHYLEREEMTALLRSMPRQGPFALRDRTLVLFLYNTGARAQEVVDLRVEHLDFQAPSKVRLHGKGDKWRLCPLWSETVKHLEQLIAQRQTSPTSPVFCARRNQPLTRFGIYKIIRRHAAAWEFQVHSHDASARICFGTPLQLIFWSRASRSTSSVDGWDTSAWIPPTDMPSSCCAPKPKRCAIASSV